MQGADDFLFLLVSSYATLCFYSAFIILLLLLTFHTAVFLKFCPALFLRICKLLLIELMGKKNLLEQRFFGTMQL